METIAAKVRFHTFAAIGSLCSIGQIGLFADFRCDCIRNQRQIGRREAAMRTFQTFAWIRPIGASGSLLTLVGISVGSQLGSLESRIPCIVRHTTRP